MSAEINSPTNQGGSVPNLPRPQELASKSASLRKGGIILFVHVPKTGGTTIRDNFSNATIFPHVKYVTVYSMKQFKAAEKMIDKRLGDNTQLDNDKSILFVEIHGHNTPTLLELEPMIRHWKEQTKSNHVALVTFTLLRDPIDFAVSFFNFFHVFGDPRFGPQLESNLVSFQETLQWNPQCLYLVKGERPYFRPDKYYNVTTYDCDYVASLLEDEAVMDFVGETHRLSTETLPRLLRLTGMSGIFLPPSNVATSRRQKNRPLLKEQLDASSLQKIQQMTTLDQQLYLQTTTQN